MIKGIFRTLLATTIIGMLCLLWRIAQPYDDWALLLFLSLAYKFFTAQLGVTRQVHQARQRVIWQEHSWPMHLLRGGLVPCLERVPSRSSRSRCWFGKQLRPRKSVCLLSHWDFAGMIGKQNVSFRLGVVRQCRG